MKCIFIILDIKVSYMPMSMEHYRTFYYAARSGSISKAADELYITQPAASRSVKQLEKQIGSPLLFRTSKGVKLTREGEILFKYIEQAFNFIETAENKINEIRKLEIGEVKIGISDTLCKHYLLPYLEVFNRDYPGVKIHVTNPTTTRIIELLKRGKIDLGIVNLPVEDDRLEIKKGFELQDCFVAGEKYGYLADREILVSELVKYPLLLLERESNTRLYIDRYFKEHGLEVIPEIELGNIDLLVQFAKIGLGISCVIRNFVNDELQKSTLFEIRLKEKIPPRNAGIVYLKDVPLSYTARKFINLLGY
jgi:DNA-binding transcriptional LysR family regulator